jgi:hypothetical protein
MMGIGGQRLLHRDSRDDRQGEDLSTRSRATAARWVAAYMELTAIGDRLARDMRFGGPRSDSAPEFAADERAVVTLLEGEARRLHGRLRLWQARLMVLAGPAVAPS